jgi:uncharacterized protein HemX
MNTHRPARAMPVLIAAALVLISAVTYAGQTEQDNKTTSKDLKRETKEAIQAIKSYSYEQRDKAVKEVKSVLNDLDGRIDRMQGQIEQKWNEMDQSSRKQLSNTMKTLREKRNRLSEWYGGLQQSSSGAWNHVKEGFIEGYDSVASAFDKAQKEFDSDGKK